MSQDRQMNDILRGVKAEIIAHFALQGNIDEVRDKITDDKVRRVMRTSLAWNGNANEDECQVLEQGNEPQKLEMIGRLITKAESGSVINDIVLHR